MPHSSIKKTKTFHVEEKFEEGFGQIEEEKEIQLKSDNKFLEEPSDIFYEVESGDNTKANITSL